VGSEKELGFGRGSSPHGEAREEEAPQRYVYKHVPEQTGVRNALSTLKKFKARFRFCLVPQGIRSTWLKRYVDMRERTGKRYDGRRLGSFLPSLLKRSLLKRSPLTRRILVTLLRGRTVGRFWSGG
jgi:hypothetical protein